MTNDWSKENNQNQACSTAFTNSAPSWTPSSNKKHWSKRTAGTVPACMSVIFATCSRAAILVCAEWSRAYSVTPMPDEQPQSRGILGDYPAGQVTDEKETDDARRIREFREAQASYGHRVVLPQRWHFH
jgi:hypothetical protein